MESEKQIIKPHEFKWLSLTQDQIDTLNGYLDLEIDRCKIHFPNSIPYYQGIKNRLNA